MSYLRVLQNIELRPITNDEIFENFIVSFFNELEATNSFNKVGRNGQKQNGYDVYSLDKKTVIQCKVRKSENQSNKKITKDLIDELKKDFKSFDSYNMRCNQKYSKFIYATTFIRNTDISIECDRLSNDYVTVEYWSWDDIKDKMPYNTYHEYFADLFPDKTIEFIYGSNDFNIDVKAPILNQIFDYFKHVFREINIVPKHFFIETNPFKIDIDFYPYFSSFKLNIDNKELFEFIKSIEYNDDKELKFTDIKFVENIDNPKEKALYVLKTFIENNIYWLQFKNLTIKLPINDSLNCNCMRCLFNKMDFNSVFKHLIKVLKEENSQNKWLSAFTIYKLGYFGMAYSHYSDLSSMSRKNGYYIQYIISKFNLVNLYRHISFWEFDNQLVHESKITKVNLTDILYTFKYNRSFEFINWILSEKFFYEKYLVISSIVSRIKEHKIIQLNGGSSHNNNLINLQCEFMDFYHFIEGNYIVFDKFTEFKDLTKLFIEGLVVSHSMNEKQKSRLEYFNDSHLKIILLYGEADNLSKNIRHNNLKYLKYQKGNTSTNIVEDVLNLFSCQNELTKSKAEFEKEFNQSQENEYFWTYLNERFSCALVICSYCNFDKEQVNLIAKALLIFLKSENCLTNYHRQNILSFLKLKGYMLSKLLLDDFLTLFISDENYHDEFFFSAISISYTKRNEKLIFESDFFNKLLDFTFNKNLKNIFGNAPGFIFKIYKLIDQKQKLRIESLIKEKLNEHFLLVLAYNALLFDVINLDDKTLFKYIKSVSNSFHTRGVNVKFSENYRIDGLVMLIELCYKFNIDLHVNEFSYFKGINQYYDWLLDLENFNYDNFKVEWLKEYLSPIYFNKFRDYPNIRMKLIDHLKNNHDNLLVDILLNIS